MECARLNDLSVFLANEIKQIDTFARDFKTTHMVNLSQVVFACEYLKES